jgi:hypothetical protein
LLRAMRTPLQINMFLFCSRPSLWLTQPHNQDFYLMANLLRI